MGWSLGVVSRLRLRDSTFKFRIRLEDGVSGEDYDLKSRS